MSKKTAAEPTGYVSDDYDEQQQKFMWHAQNARSVSLSRFRTFLGSDNGAMVNPSGCPTTNIYEKKGKCYNIPPHRINEFFKHLAACCGARDFVLFTERQQEPSGLMIDLDIYQDSDHSKLTTTNVHLLCARIVDSLTKLLRIDEPRVIWHVAVTKKPSVKYCNEKRCYKDGLHCLIPSVKLSRAAKRFVIEYLIKEKVVSKALKDVPVNAEYLKEAVLGGSDGYIDQNSAFVPVFFYGCSTKHDEQQRISKPYELMALYEALVVSDQQDTPVGSVASTVNVPTEMIAAPTTNRLAHYTTILSDVRQQFIGPGSLVNLQHELSVNFEAPDGLIKKHAYQVVSQYLDRVTQVAKQLALGASRLENLERQLRSSDQELRDMLDILDQRRADQYGPWLEILRSLANTSQKNKDLAEYFSRKSRKFNKADFERTWAKLCESNGGAATGRNTVGTIFHRARQDNPDRYAEIKKNSTMTVITDSIHHKCNRGELGHADFAEILHKQVGHRFKTDYPPGQKDHVWYEFIEDFDQCISGELYKWIKHPKIPNALIHYVCHEMKRSMEQAYDHLTVCANNAQDENQKYYKLVHENLRHSIKRLSDNPFIKNIVDMAKVMFAQRGFAERLDKDPMIRGVSNGILRLSCAADGRPELIEGYHDYAVSRYFRVPYVPFNPRDPDTKKLLHLLRNLFPADEIDSFEFTMYYLASSIDGQSKESMFMILYGPGKNGKSKLVELHRAALGDYCVKLPLSFLTCPNPPSAAATPDMAKLRDATLTTFSESKQGECLQTSRIKEMTGGETVAARPLYSEIINFKPRSHFLVTTNFEFTVEGDDYGTWRRMLFNPFKIKFVDENDRDLQSRLVKRRAEARAAGLSEPAVTDILDPNERWSDDTMTDEWIESPEIAGRYLGILVWFHYWLHHHSVYKGKLANVPHPHIKYETDKYHARQSPVKEFLRMRLVKRADVTIPMALSDATRIYQDWYTRHWRQTAPSSRVIIDQLKNSSIGAAIRSTDRGDQLVGYRFLGEGEEKEADEEMGLVGETFAIPEDNFGVRAESTEEFYERICREFDQHAEIFTSGVIGADVDMATDLGLGATQGGPGVQRERIHPSGLNFEEIPMTDNDAMQVCGNAAYESAARADGHATRADGHATRADNLPGVAHMAWDNEQIERYSARYSRPILAASDARILPNGRMVRSVATAKDMDECRELCELAGAGELCELADAGELCELADAGELCELAGANELASADELCAMAEDDIDDNNMSDEQEADQIVKSSRATSEESDAIDAALAEFDNCEDE